MNTKKIIKKESIHSWLRTNFGTPNKCEHCGTTDKDKNYDWANTKQHKYKRIREDFIRLCRSCHRKYDKVIPPSRKGKHHTEEAKAKIREFAITRKWNSKGFI